MLHINQIIEFLKGCWRRISGDSSSRTCDKKISEHQFEEMVSGVKDYAIFALDTEGNVKSWNDGAHFNKGYEASEIIGKNFSCFYPAADQEAGKPALALEQARQGRYEDDGWRVRKDGSMFWANVVINPIFSKGKLVGFTKVTKNNTDRRQAQETQTRLAVEMKAVAESDKLKTEFLSTVTHELRTPAGAIQGFLALLKQGKITEEQSELLSGIELASNNLSLLIDEILTFSDLQTTSNIASKTNFPISEIRKQALSTFSGHASRKNLHISFVSPEEDIHLHGAFAFIKDVTFNLIGNAIKFTDQGYVQVNAKILQGDKNFLRIEVSDTGPGIPGDKIKKLFSPFHQLDRSHNRKVGGLGLGLACARRMVELMNGTINAENRPSSGSRFWFQIPIDIVSHLESVDNVESFGSLHILLVEDTPLHQKITTAILNKLGHKVSVAANGSEALEFLNKNSFDLILMDCQMPVMDGFECTQKIRQIEYLKHLPVIALTANFLPKDRERCTNAGMNDFVAKPAKLADLAEVLKKWQIKRLSDAA